MSDDKLQGKSPRTGRWQPRVTPPAAEPGRQEEPAPGAKPELPAEPAVRSAPSPSPGSPTPAPARATPTAKRTFPPFAAYGPPDAPRSRPRREEEEYVPFVPSVPLKLSGRAPFTAPPDVGGDLVLTADNASTDLATRSMGRLGGRAIALAGLVVVLGVVLSRVLGWGRSAVFAAEFGSSRELDAFFSAFRIPDTLFQLVAAGAIGSALVPVASELIARGEDDRARRLISTMANLMVLIVAPLAALAWLLAPLLVPIVTPGFNAHDTATTLELTRLMLFSPVLLAVGAVMAAGLNSLGLFGAPALAPNVYNLIIIAAAILLTPALGISALAVGVVAGAAGHVLTQALQFRSNRLYEPVLDFHDPAVRETLLLMGPRALGLGATQLVFLVYTMFTSTLPAGDVTSFNLTFTALQIPVGLIGVPLGIVLLPPLSQAFALGQSDRFRSLVDQSLRLLLFVVVLVTGLMVALAAPTITLLYQYGKIDAAAAAAMVPVYLVFLVGLVAHVLIALLAPIFYAGKDTRTPVAAALVAVAVDIGAALVLFPFFQLQGLALAIGLGAWIEVLMLVTRLEQHVGFDLRPLLRHSVSFAGGAIVAAAGAFLTARVVELHSAGTASLAGRLEMLVPAGLVGLALYALWARIFRLPELQAGLDLARTLVGTRDSKGATELPDS